MGNIIGTLVLGLLAVGAFGIAWSMVKEELQFLAGSRIVDGEVVDHVFQQSESQPLSPRSPGAYYPVVRYVTESGQEHRVQARVGAENRNTLTGSVVSGREHRPPGTRMRVAYRRDDQGDARVLGFSQQYLLPLITFVIGLMLLMFAGLVLHDGISPGAPFDPG